MSDDIASEIEQGMPSAMWRRYGVAKVPALLPAIEVQRLQRFAGRVYDAVAREVERSSPVDAELRDSFTTWNGVPLATLPRFLHRYEPALARELRVITAQIAAAVHRRIHSDDGRHWPRWRVLLGASYLRRHTDKSAYVPWHIDADAAGTAGISHGCFNVWLPLEEVGIASPSLQLIPGSHRQMRERPLLQGADWPYRTEDWVASSIQGPIWTPRLRPGDAIVFDQFTLHRTQPSGAAKLGRTSCEFRFVDIPHSWLPLARRALKARAHKVAGRLGIRQPSASA